ncbi:MAG: vWA domain-containing protein, partial [Acidobacteriota bacterium]
MFSLDLAKHPMHAVLAAAFVLVLAVPATAQPTELVDLGSSNPQILEVLRTAGLAGGEQVTRSGDALAAMEVLGAGSAAYPLAAADLRATLLLDDGRDAFRLEGSSQCLGMLDVRFVDAAGRGIEVPGAQILASREADAGLFVTQAVSRIDRATQGEQLLVHGGARFHVDVSFLQGADEHGVATSFARSFRMTVGCDQVAPIGVKVPTVGFNKADADHGFAARSLPAEADPIGRLLDSFQVVPAGHGRSAAPLGRNFSGQNTATGGETSICTLDTFEDADPDGPWSSTLLGDADQGSAVESGGRFLVSGNGTSLYHGTDNAFFTHQDADGDFRVETTITDFPSTPGGDFQKGGLFVQAGTGSSEPRVMVQLIPDHPDPTIDNMLIFDIRDDAGNAVALASNQINLPLPLSIAIDRRGDWFTVYFSTDGGASWAVPAGALGGSAYIPMPDTVKVGMAVASYNNSVQTVAEFDDFSLCRPNGDPLPEPPPPLACRPGAVFDVLYLVDASGSMTDTYPGAASKIDAARDAIGAMNQLLLSELPGSRAGLISFTGKGNAPFNLNGAVTVRSGFTTDLAAVDAAAATIDTSVIDPASSTPLAIALERTLQLMVDEHDPARLPVIILFTDTVPNIDIRGDGPLEYLFPEVQAISLYDGAGEFLPWGTVAWSGNYNSSLDTYDGEVLANAMYQILRIEDAFPDTLMVGVAIQGDGVTNDVFRTDLLEFGATYTGGDVYSVDDSASIIAALQDVVSVVNCGASIAGTVWDDADGNGLQDGGGGAAVDHRNHVLQGGDDARRVVHGVDVAAGVGG